MPSSGRRTRETCLRIAKPPPGWPPRPTFLDTEAAEATDGLGVERHLEIVIKQNRPSWIMTSIRHHGISVIATAIVVFSTSLLSQCRCYCYSSFATTKSGQPAPVLVDPFNFTRVVFLCKKWQLLLKKKTFVSRKDILSEKMTFLEKKISQAASCNS